MSGVSTLPGRGAVSSFGAWCSALGAEFEAMVCAVCAEGVAIAEAVDLAGQ